MLRTETLHDINVHIKILFDKNVSKQTFFSQSNNAILWGKRSKTYCGTQFVSLLIIIYQVIDTWFLIHYVQSRSWTMINDDMSDDKIAA